MNKSVNKSVIKGLRVFGWVFLIFLIVLLFLDVNFLGHELLQAPANIGPYHIRYLDVPYSMAIHIGAGVLFVLLGATQFIPWIRRKHIKVHRVIGWILVVSAITSGIFGMIATTLMKPMFVGIGQLSMYVFGSLFVFCIAMGVYRIKQKKILEHRRWMIRAFAIAVGIINTRAYVIGLLISGDPSFFEGEKLGWVLAFAWTTNLLLAELWIRLTPKRV
jgi:uncharacterized membrane protein